MRDSTSCVRHLAMGLAIAGLVVVAGCNDNDSNSDGGGNASTAPPASTSRTAEFSEISPAQTDEEKRAVRATPGLTVVESTDGASQKALLTADTAGGPQYTAGFQTILRSGDEKGGNRFGVLTAKNGDPVLAEDNSQTVADSNDFSSLLRFDDKLFMVSHFESRPGSMYVSSLVQDADTGQLTATSTRPIDFSPDNGLWVPCAGSVTPWGTHLGGEEYEPNARAVDASTGSIDSYYDAMGAYISGSYGTADQGLTELNPYDYGWPTEISITSDAGDVDVTKHFSMGRKANELAYVMPDEKTVYNTDDGTNVGLYMFIADTAGDLSAGTLYAMKWNQTSAADGGAADLDWIDLGHATDAQVGQFLGRDGGSKLTFTDLFNTAEANTEDDASPLCPSGFTGVNTNGLGPECLQVKDGMDLAASRLETRRYAAIKGATLEMRKEEGFTFDPDAKRFYVAISEREAGMEDFMQDGNPSTANDLGTSNDIRLPYDICGTVYSGSVGTDSDIGSDYVAKNIVAEVSGTMTQAIDPNSPIPQYAADSPLANNVCDVAGIANPDNITYMPGYHTLIIGEDSGSGHQNDMVWAYNTTDKKLTRIETTPYGSESTSIYFYPDYNGFAYLMSVVQHPYGESDSDKLETADQARGYTGYIGPFPALEDTTASVNDDATPAG
ncbi:alkaline phosphatase PhoX [Salinisphaera aquimarina]|uniref:Alkaline phosphatase PhoX n=1 Tax=Salinisphaera aquimarina TaxID=2094031 RepID=A0ABV7ER99_9GAMM